MGTETMKTPGLADRFPALRNLITAKKGRVPVVRQLSEIECGAACLAMVLGYHGKPTRLEEVRQVMGVARDGVSALDILRTARTFGLRGGASRSTRTACASCPRAPSCTGSSRTS